MDSLVAAEGGLVSETSRANLALKNLDFLKKSSFLDRIAKKSIFQGRNPIFLIFLT